MNPVGSRIYFEDPVSMCILNKKYKLAYFAVFALALSLRIGLATVNREANDFHMHVIQLMDRANPTWSGLEELPEIDDCDECFHPKLFYYVAGWLLHAAKIKAMGAKIVFVQILNAAAGFAAIAILWLFIQGLPAKHEYCKLAVFSLISLNSRFIGINAQSSNDTFVFLLGTLALYHSYLFVRTLDIKLLFSVIVFSSLAIATKVTAGVAVIAVFMSLLIAAWFCPQRRRTYLLSAVTLPVAVGMLTIANPLTQCLSNYKQYGVPFVNTSKIEYPLPGLFEKSYLQRPGITSIQDGFLTFKFIDLIQHPRITHGATGYPEHRTSFWTKLYANSNSIQWLNWPRSWSLPGRQGYSITRAIFIVALVPAGILVTGFLQQLALFIQGMRPGRSEALRQSGCGLLLLIFLGYISFLMLSEYLFRDYSFIKPDYIMPILISVAWLLLSGFEAACASRRGVYRLLAPLSLGVTFLLALLYVADVLVLIRHLYTSNIPA